MQIHMDLPALPEEVSTPKLLHSFLLCNDPTISPINGVQRRLAAVYQSLGSRDAGHISTELQFDASEYKPRTLSRDVEGSLVISSTRGAWAARQWRVEIEFDLEWGGPTPGRRLYPMDRRDLRALSRGWGCHTVTIETTSQRRVQDDPPADDEWHVYTFHRHDPPERGDRPVDEILWRETFVAAAWEAYLHEQVLRDIEAVIS